MLNEDLLPLINKVIVQIRNKDQNAFSTEEEQSKYLGKLISEYKGYNFSSQYRESVRTLKKRITELDPKSIDYTLVESTSYILEHYKRRAKAYDVYLLSNYILDAEWDGELLEYFEGLFLILIYRMGDLSVIRQDLKYYEETKWTAKDNARVREMLHESNTFQEISEELNKSILDIVSHLSTKKTILNFETVYYRAIFETALDDSKLYTRVYEEYGDYCDSEYLDMLSI